MKDKVHFYEYRGLRGGADVCGEVKATSKQEAMEQIACKHIFSTWISEPRDYSKPRPKPEVKTVFVLTNKAITAIRDSLVPLCVFAFFLLAIGVFFLGSSFVLSLTLLMLAALGLFVLFCEASILLAAGVAIGTIYVGMLYLDDKFPEHAAERSAQAARNAEAERLRKKYTPAYDTAAVRSAAEKIDAHQADEVTNYEKRELNKFMGK